MTRRIWCLQNILLNISDVFFIACPCMMHSLNFRWSANALWGNSSDSAIIFFPNLWMIISYSLNTFHTAINLKLGPSLPHRLLKMTIEFVVVILIFKVTEFTEVKCCTSFLCEMIGILCPTSRCSCVYCESALFFIFRLMTSRAHFGEFCYKYFPVLVGEWSEHLFWGNMGDRAGAETLYREGGRHPWDRSL